MTPYFWGKLRYVIINGELIKIMIDENAKIQNP